MASASPTRRPVKLPGPRPQAMPRQVGQADPGGGQDLVAQGEKVGRVALSGALAPTQTYARQRHQGDPGGRTGGVEGQQGRARGGGCRLGHACVSYHERVKKLGRVEESLESVDARLEEIERKMDRLRVLYENFFMGVDRMPPNVPRRELNRLMLEMQQTPLRNATMRFRFQTLQQRWVLLTTYWNRTLREIEMGTYRRDLDRANRHLAAKGGAPMTEDEALRLGIPANRAKAFVARHNQQAAARAGAATTADGVQPAPAPAAPAGGGAASAVALPGLRDGALEDFYQRYVKAHTDATGRATKGVAGTDARQAATGPPEDPDPAELRPRRTGRRRRWRQGPLARPAGEVAPERAIAPSGWWRSERSPRLRSNAGAFLPPAGPPPPP